VPDEETSEEEDGDELMIPAKGKKKKDVAQRVGFSPPVQPRPPTPPPTTPAPKPALPEPPSPVPSDSGTLIATPQRPSTRHVRTRNSHTSLRSLAAGSLRSLFAGPHHPLSSPTATSAPGRREAAAPPVISGETARGAWAFSGDKEPGLPPTPTTTNTRLPRPNAAGSLRKASFTGATEPHMGRLSAHSVAAKAAQLPTMGRTNTLAIDARHQQERESVNLVSRFIPLPAAPTHEGKAPVFPDSPFAGAHASLVRTLMEEGARLLPVEPTPLAPRRTDTIRAPRPQRTTSTFPSASTGSGSVTIPYGASPAPPGQEWVLGLTPFEMSVQRCVEQRKGAVRLATGRALGPLGV
jgi:hypothetical protein